MAGMKRSEFAEEAAEVEVLYANLEKMKSLTKKIQGSMSRLDVSGRTVQDAIGPVYGNTKRLQTTTANVERILAAIEKAKEPLDMRNKEERILRSPPEQVGLSEYISSVDRTIQALKELKSSNLRSNQAAIADLHSLLKPGIQNLEGVFRDYLRRDSEPIEPLKQITTKTEFPRLNASKSAQLRTINTHVAAYAQLTSPGSLSACAKAYASERGQYITASLQNLATASISTARKVSADSIYKQGSNAIGSYAEGILGMYTAEYDNICPIFSREEWGPVLQATCQGSLTAFAHTVRELDNHVKANLITDCYLAYEIVEVVSKTSYQLESKTGELKYALSDALKPVRETAKSSLATLLQDTRVRVQQLQALSPDGGAVPITTETMTRLQRMTAYSSPLSSIMRSLGDGGWAAPQAALSSNSIPSLKSFDVGADGKELFAHYCMDTIETLLHNLESATRRFHKGKSLQGVFMSNNIAIIERMIHASELDSLLVNVQSKMDGWKRKATAQYLEAWKEPSVFLLDVQYTSKTPRPTSTGQGIDSAALIKSMSSKDRESIKEKFRNFNASFDELVAKHKSFRMESEVRRDLARGVQGVIEPLYSRFWERYHEVDKGKGKHVKYDKSQLAAVVASLA